MQDSVTQMFFLPDKYLLEFRSRERNFREHVADVLPCLIRKFIPIVVIARLEIAHHDVTPVLKIVAGSSQADFRYWGER
jgi:hypothetical protein